MPRNRISFGLTKPRILIHISRVMPQECNLLRTCVVLLTIAWAGSFSASPLFAQNQETTNQSLLHFQNGVEYFHQGSFKAAELEFQQAARLKDDLAAAYYNLGVIHHLRDDFQGALKYYNKSVSICEDDPEFHYSLGLIYYQMGDIKKSIEHLEMTTLLDPSDADAFYHLAIACHANGDSERAAAAYEQSVMLNPEIKRRSFRPQIGGENLQERDFVLNQEMGFSGTILSNPQGRCEFGAQPPRRKSGFPKSFQIGFSIGPGFPENYLFKQVSTSPDRMSYLAHLGLAVPRGPNFLSAFGGDGYGFFLKGGYTDKRTGQDKWAEYSLAANIRIFENIDVHGRSRFFISFGPGVYIIRTDFGSGTSINSQYGIEGGAGADYLLFPFVFIFGEGNYSFCYHGREPHTNSLGYLHIGISLRF